MVNAFVDLGTWNCFTPFVGAGIGAAYNTAVGLHRHQSLASPASAFGRNPSEWHFAWALYAGVSYNVTKNFKVDLTYRYLNYRLDHRHRRLLRRLQSRLVQVRQALLARHHARPALDLLRLRAAATATALRLCAAASGLRAAAAGLCAAASGLLPAAAAVAQQGLTHV